MFCNFERPRCRLSIWPSTESADDRNLGHIPPLQLGEEIARIHSGRAAVCSGALLLQSFAGGRLYVAAQERCYSVVVMAALSRRNIIREIRRLHARRAPLNIPAIKRSHPKLLERVYAVRPFWGWKRALEDAGLDQPFVCSGGLEGNTPQDRGPH